MPLRSDLRKIGCSAQISSLFRLPTSIVPSALLAASYAQIVLADRPLLYFQMDETSGTTATDSSGNGYNGTISGTVTLGATSNPKLGTAYTFGGGNISVTNAAFETLETTATFTIEAWINPSNLTSVHTIFCQGSSSAYEFRLETSGKLNLFQSGIGGGGLSTGTVSTGSWHHVAVAVGGGAMTFYIDGSASGTGTPPSASSFNQVYVGVRSPGSEAFAGGIDEFAIYTTKLTAARIAAHYAAG